MTGVSPELALHTKGGSRQVLGISASPLLANPILDTGIYVYVCFCHPRATPHVEEVPQNMFCISSAEENIIMEMPQKIRI